MHIIYKNIKFDIVTMLINKEVIKHMMILTYKRILCTHKKLLGRSIFVYIVLFPTTQLT